MDRGPHGTAQPITQRINVGALFMSQIWKTRLDYAPPLSLIRDQ